jgi:hypothetical protein
MEQVVAQNSDLGFAVWAIGVILVLVACILV